MHLDKQRALRTKHNTEMRQLLGSIELYKQQHGTLPPSLEELKKVDTHIKDISITDYVYETSGIVVKDGSRWLLAVTRFCGHE